MSPMFPVQTKFAWNSQNPIADDQNPPVTDTWYTLLDVKGGVRIHEIQVYQSNTETNSKEIQFRITMDGRTPFTGSKDMDHNTNYWVNIERNEEGISAIAEIKRGAGNTKQAQTAADAASDKYSDAFECETLVLEYRNHDAAGTAQRLKAWIPYDLKEAI